MIFTDCQMWNNTNRFNAYTDVEGSLTFKSSWTVYKEINPKVKLYLFDLSGYGNTPVSVNKDVYLIAGWNEKIFDILENIENGKEALEEIRKIEV